MYVCVCASVCVRARVCACVHVCVHVCTSHTPDHKLDNSLTARGHVTLFPQLPAGACNNSHFSSRQCPNPERRILRLGRRICTKSAPEFYAKYKQKNDRLKAAPNGMRVNSAMLANTGDYIHVHSQTLCETCDVCVRSASQLNVFLMPSIWLQAQLLVP